MLKIFKPIGVGFLVLAVNDQASGYSLPFIESEMLQHISGLISVSQQLKNNKPAGVTDVQIDLLINFFN